MTTEYDIKPLGPDGVLVRFGTKLTDAANARAITFRDMVADAALDGVTEIASALTSVRVGFDPARTNRAAITKAVETLLTQDIADQVAISRIWHIPACFNADHAPQLAEAAELAGVTPEQAVKDFTENTVRVIALGFAPGQPYLGMLPERWNIPRQSELTPFMPRGALIVAIRQFVLFNADAPTGWRKIGQTAFQGYRPDDTDPFPLRAGDGVRFHAVSGAEFDAIRADAATNGGARCEVLS